MKVCVGPVDRTSARAWTGWARERLLTLRGGQSETTTLPAQVLEDVGSYLDSWAGAAGSGSDAFRWHVDFHSDELEYLANSLYNLDLHLADEGRWRPARAEPTEGRAFHVVLVEALLFALAQEGPSQAAFADQLRPGWPMTEPVALSSSTPFAG